MEIPMKKQKFVLFELPLKLLQITLGLWKFQICSEFISIKGHYPCMNCMLELYAFSCMVSSIMCILCILTSILKSIVKSMLPTAWHGIAAWESWHGMKLTMKLAWNSQSLSPPAALFLLLLLHHGFLPESSSFPYTSLLFFQTASPHWSDFNPFGLD